MHNLLKCLGVGDGWPSAARNHSAFLYQLGHTRFLMDCGEPVSRALLQSGMGCDAVDRIFLSHLHFDHIGGFFMLMQGLWLHQRRKDLTVHLPADGIEPIRRLLDAACIFKELLGFRLTFEPLESGQPVRVNGAQVTPFPTTHLDGFRKAFAAKYPQGYEAFSFLIESGGLRIGHSADVGAPEDLAPLVAQPLDLLVCELAHLKPEALFRFLRGRPVQRLLFIHLTEQQLEHIEQIKAQASAALGEIPFSFAREGEEVPLAAAEATVSLTQ